VGLLAVSLQIARLADARMRAAANAVLHGAVAIAVAASVLMNYRKVDLSDNRVARTYATDLLAGVPPNAILILESDDKVMAVEYLLEVEGTRPDVSLIKYGVFKTVSSPWYIPEVRRRYPQLTIPFDAFDGHTIPIERFLDANQSRPIITADGINIELGNRYWFYEAGLVVKILPASQSLSVQDAAAEFERLLPLYHPPPPGAMRARTFEGGYPRAYALPAFNIARGYEAIHDKAAAKRWYQRALALDPGYQEADAAIRRF
jgi:hypothetical protein